MSMVYGGGHGRGLNVDGFGDGLSGNGCGNGDTADAEPMPDNMLPDGDGFGDGDNDSVGNGDGAGGHELAIFLSSYYHADNLPALYACIQLMTKGEHDGTETASTLA